MADRSISEAGFTLLEVMVALAILAIGLTVLYSSQSRSLFVAGISDFTVTSAGLGSTRMAEILSEDSSERLLSGDFGPPYDGYSWRAVFENSDNAAGLIPPGAAANLERIDLTITDSRRDESFTMRRYRFRVK